jgi:hypothetical protein
MLPSFLIHENTVRESGESSLYLAEEYCDRSLMLTLGITHATEQESLDVEVYASPDGKKWPHQPIASFTRKYYCGTYQLLLSGHEGRFLKAVWKVNRWGRGESKPFFRFYLFAQESRVRAAAGAA